MTQRGARHDACHLQILASTLAFIRKEIKEMILLDRTSEGCAERVAQEEGRFVRQILRDLSIFIEPVVRGSKRGPVVPIRGPVDVVCAALCNQSDLSARGTASISCSIACRNTKFLQRIERGPQGAGKGETLSLIVVVDAIERDIGLVAARAIH